MSHPHDYQRHTAPKAYLKREFVEPYPRQITFAGMIGSYRISVLDLSEHYQTLKQGLDEPLIAQAISNDKGGIHLIRGTVKHYILIVDDIPAAVFDTEGRFIHEASEEEISTSRAVASIKGRSISFEQK
ncbi:hypothetical protein [Aliidiomarina quisquiliarum]|uniref:hypothetical protein n=1 Tax=Aliidiomarina quisquiliarum TaxID=2938947 RepID=UPI00208F1959|nr:hypothetical protein [Aliidiomarina quisquiliarum]MCO4321409.1 hypothetical protein [Aliidiomarina quisquiliarum]